MGESGENFITEFHNLPGITVKDKHKNLFSLLRLHSSLSHSSEELDAIITNLKPTNHLEKIFYVDVLIHFRRFTELYEQYLHGDGITVSKVSKQDWFYQKAFKEITPKDFVNRFLPNLSYSIKAKVLKKLPLDEKRADEVFDALQKKYGVFLASVTLPKCTKGKIREVLTSHPIQLTESQLQTIHKKSPELIYVYIEERIKHVGSFEFLARNSFFTYVAQNDQEMFHNLLNKYKFDANLGRRTTKRYIASLQNHVLQKREIYVNILNKRMFVRKLGSELKDLFFKYNKESGLQYWHDILEHYPKNQQFNIYKELYNLTYSNKFGENIDAIPERILKIMPDLKEREKIAKVKLAKEENKDYLKYVTPKYCLQEFMEQVNYMTSSTERAKFVEIATECCILNKDLDSLLKILELLCLRFKNDEARIRESFFCTITQDKNLLDTFTEQHWNMIMEIIAIARAKDEWINGESTLRTSHLIFLFRNKRCIKDAILKCVKDPELICNSNLGKWPKLYKLGMKEFIEIGLAKPDPTHKYHAAEHDCNLAYMCQAFNERYPEDTIHIYDHPRIRQSVKQVLENEAYSDFRGYNFRYGVEYIICQPNLPEEFVELKNLYFKGFKFFGRSSGVFWFLKNEPEILKNNLNYFLDHFHKNWSLEPEPIWRYIKKYTHLDLDKAVIEFCKSKLGEEEYQHKTKLIKALSILSTADSYLEYMESYRPSSLKVDLADDNTKILYSVQTQLIKFMHGVHSPERVLPVALELCKGDYVKYALSPVYSCFYTLPEKETKPFIEKLKDNKAVSVKKHAIKLTCVLYDVDTVHDSLQNATVPCLIATLKYFAKNPSDVLWQLIETQICDIEKKYLHVLTGAIAIRIPSKYKGKYVETIWKVLDKYENKEIRKSLITNIDKESIKNLNPQFAFQIIRNSIFNLEEANDFVAEVLINLNNNEKFEVFSSILKEFKKNCWNCAEARAARRALSNFIYCLFAKYAKSEQIDNKFVDEVSALFKAVFSTSEAFEESLLISSMAFKGNSVENNSKLLINLNNCVDKEYSHFAVRLVADVIKTTVFAHICTMENEQLKLCYSLLKIRESVNDSLLILMLLPEKQPEDLEHFSLYNEILKELSVSDDNLVQLQLNFYLKLRSEENGKSDCNGCWCVILEK